ncbi:shelterin complex subunit Taz1 [Schizosaccharomyces osmophilus]|uniref:Shelterin complex subunit Taz1 n=1 Tax=Schizosaccharomyces osmophilus TaxID=2545709 RepID=A0AAF0AV59_9SCHI|nr:shelterin complex subunit Taz1 [Schizosaccharomyces osmophilus]WBW71599.1 shelterin complex subunit Taz1 [Schizosaccharomyces osmophilus]
MSEASPLSRKANEKAEKSEKLENIASKGEKNENPNFPEDANGEGSDVLGPVDKANVSSNPSMMEQPEGNANVGYQWDFERASKMAKDCPLLANLAYEMSKVFCDVFAEFTFRIDGPQNYFEKFDDKFLTKVRDFSNDLVSTYGLDITVFLSYIQANEPYQKLFEMAEIQLSEIQFFTGTIDLFDVSNKHFVLMAIVIDSLLVVDEDSSFYTAALRLFEELVSRYCFSNTFPYKKNPEKFLFTLLPYKSQAALDSVGRSVWKKQNIFDYLKGIIEKCISSPPKEINPYRKFVITVFDFLTDSQSVRRLHNTSFGPKKLTAYPENYDLLSRLRKRVSMSSSPPGKEPEKPLQKNTLDAGEENHINSETEADNLPVFQSQAGEQVDENSETQPKEAAPSNVYEDTIESSSTNRKKINDTNVSEVEVLQSISEELSIAVASLSEQTITSVHNQASSLLKLIEERIKSLQEREKNTTNEQRAPSVQNRFSVNVNPNAVSDVSSVEEEDEDFPPIRNSSLKDQSNSNRTVVMRTSTEKAEGRSESRRQDSPYEGYKLRRKWTEEQEREVFNMIEQYGCSWSKIVYIQRIDNKPLSHFTPTHIKDKARLIKARYMKQNQLQNLYQHSPNWKYVTVGPAYCEIHKIPYSKEASAMQ